MVNPVVLEQPEPSQDAFVLRDSPVAIDELSGSLPVNAERAIVLYDPMNNNMPSRSPFSISVNSDFLSGFKSKFLTQYLYLIDSSNEILMLGEKDVG